MITDWLPAPDSVAAK